MIYPLQTPSRSTNSFDRHANCGSTLIRALHTVDPLNFMGHQSSTRKSAFIEYDRDRITPFTVQIKVRPIIWGFSKECMWVGDNGSDVDPVAFVNVACTLESSRATGPVNPGTDLRKSRGHRDICFH